MEFFREEGKGARGAGVDALTNDSGINNEVMKDEGSDIITGAQIVEGIEEKSSDKIIGVKRNVAMDTA